MLKLTVATAILAAPQSELVTSACMLSPEFLCLDGLHAPIHLCFYVRALKAMFISSFSGITTSTLQESAACAFITRDQRLSSSRRLSAQTRHRTHRTRAIQQSSSAQRGSFTASVWGHVKLLYLQDAASAWTRPHLAQQSLDRSCSACSLPYTL